MNSSHTTAATAEANGAAGENCIIQSSGATAADDRKQNLNGLIKSIHNTLAILDQLYGSVSSSKLGLQFSPLQLLNDLVLELDNITRLVGKCSIRVPMEVVNLIDEGKNPDIITRNLLNESIAKNQIVKGKTDAFKCLLMQLVSELYQTFPHELIVYRDIYAAYVAEVKRMQLAGDSKVLTQLRNMAVEQFEVPSSSTG